MRGDGLIHRCVYCGMPTTEHHEILPQRDCYMKKFGKDLIYHPLNCVPACNMCNAGHANVETRNEYQFVVAMVEGKVMKKIPYKLDRKALKFILEKQREGFLRVENNKVWYE